MTSGAIILNNTRRHGAFAMNPHIRFHLVGDGGREIWTEGLLYAGIDAGIGDAGSKSLRDRISTSDVRPGAGLR